MTNWLVQGYLGVNALLYGFIALRMARDPDAESSAAGLVLSSRDGRAEFLASHAGLPLALAAVFTILALEPGAHRLGLKIGIALYVPVLLFRFVPPLIAANRFGFMAAPAAIETALLIGAITLLLGVPSGTGGMR